MVARTLAALPFDEPVSELSLLIPSWQLGRLEQQAYSQGMTVAEMLRRLIAGFLEDARAASCAVRAWTPVSLEP